MNTRSRPVGITKIFSKRKAIRTGQLPEIQSENLPERFRVQVAHIFINTIGRWVEPRRHEPPDFILRPSNDAWVTIFRRVTEEHGRFFLTDPNVDPATQCLNYMLTAKTDEALDVIEVALQYIDNELRRVDPYAYLNFTGITPRPDDAIREFNTRCLENGVAYAYMGGEIVPSPSPYLHAEVVEPALALLHEQGFRGAQDEFLSAHRHLRRGETKSAIVAANNAFESTMKAICDRKQWTYETTDTAGKLVAALIREGFIPTYLQTHLSALRSLLDSGVPVVRNKGGGHGQGSEPVEVPRERAEYALHMTATNIVFLVKLLKG
jgi:hypothetical protein